MKRIFVLALILLLVGSAGCSAQVSQPETDDVFALPMQKVLVSESFQAAVKEVAGIYLGLDADAVRFTEALETVDGYLQGNISQEKAMKKLEEIRTYFEKTLEAQAPYKISEKTRKELMEQGISVQEFLSYGSSRSTELYDQVEKMNYILFYLEEAEQFQDARTNLKFGYDNYVIYHKEVATYYYYGGLNYWFMDADARELEYLQENLIGKIRCYLPEDPQWYTTEAEIDAKVEEFFIEYEKIVAAMSGNAGKEEQSLLIMQRVYGKLEAVVNTLSSMNLEDQTVKDLVEEAQDLAGALSEAMYADDLDQILELEGRIDLLAEKVNALAD